MDFFGLGHTPRTETVIRGMLIPNLCLWMREAKIQQMRTQKAAFHFRVSEEGKRESIERLGARVQRGAGRG